MSITIESQETEAYLIKTRRYFHSFPELSFQEHNTAEIIEEELANIGLEPRRIAKTGVIADIKGPESGKAVAIRADIDAIPIEEKNSFRFKSKKKGVMHACGHDAHIAMALGAAKILMHNRFKLKGTVRMLFQPAEEMPPGGALEMIKQGALKDINYIIGQHVWSRYPIGTVAIYYGQMMANSDKFSITIEGKGGHGSAPQEAVDALETACEYVVHAQTIVSRRIPPVKPAVVTFGTMVSGYRHNIIAPNAKLTGTVRTFDAITRDRIKYELRETLAGICKSTHAKYRYKYSIGYPALVNHEEVSRTVENVASEVLGSNSILHPEPDMGGEDFAYYLEKIPGAFYFLGVGNIKKGITSPQHSPTYTIDENAMKFGTEILTRSALKLLT
jgi:amidohydrolase